MIDYNNPGHVPPELDPYTPDPPKEGWLLKLDDCHGYVGGAGHLELYPSLKAAEFGQWKQFTKYGHKTTPEKLL